MELTLTESFQACEEIAHKRARNFYYAFRVLPKSKRLAICSMYAFMRYCDDIADSDDPPTSKIDALRRWRNALTDALGGDVGKSRILPAFCHSVRKYSIPESYFYELIEGAEMDQSKTRYQTFDDLYQYCYRVASVVGLVCIHIFGFSEEVAKTHAEYCGIAFQLTNILRDVREDADHDRIYLPLNDMTAAGYSEEDLRDLVFDNAFRKLMKLEAQRARRYYEHGIALLDYVDPVSRPCLGAMIGIYSSLLDKIESENYDVLSQRISLSAKQKISIAARSTLGYGVDRREPVSVGPRGLR
jgi:15-cis-phytoene synthase